MFVNGIYIYIYIIMFIKKLWIIVKSIKGYIFILVNK